MDEICPSSSSATCLSINLAAIQRNFTAIQSYAGQNVSLAAVLKANAYGLGAKPIANALYDAGCHFFYVAYLQEAIELRSILQKDATIAVLHGVAVEECDAFTQHQLTPVLNHPEQFSCWLNHAKKHATNLDVLLHVDSGMNRLGFTIKDAIDCLQNDVWQEHLTIHYLMSHIACANDYEHPHFIKQQANFEHICRQIPNFSKSFAASSACFRKTDIFYDQLRLGGVLYGIHELDAFRDNIELCFSLNAPILQCRTVDADGSVGYGATYTVKKGDTLATLPMGYADGYPRGFSNQGYGILHHKCGMSSVPIAGIISMDMLCVDISAIDPVLIDSKSYVELMGSNLHPNDVAGLIGIHNYELMTSLSNRLERIYHYDGDIVSN